MCVCVSKNVSEPCRLGNGVFPKWSGTFNEVREFREFHR